ncbi:hypothetical protein Sgleb_71010 [Streptomyces glebosus]|uniref:Uncharacterized protein n=1 Tax=Streptomyces glebosus TaxID=249580 RepID=A0A640T795_9ACTN|nr:hypothetical protein Sgleb_71010 [Streptomyces glebosus]
MTANIAVITAEANRVRAVRMDMFLSACCEGRHPVGLLRRSSDMTHSQLHCHGAPLEIPETGRIIEPPGWPEHAAVADVLGGKGMSMTAALSPASHWPAAGGFVTESTHIEIRIRN